MEMTLHEWLDQKPGRSSWLARQLKRSKTAVSLWRDDGVPLPLIKQISHLTDGEVSERAMLEHALECKSRQRQAA